MLDLVSRCLVYQQVKVKHKRPGGMLQLLPRLEWKWDCNICDCVTDQLPIHRQLDIVWVIVDRLINPAHIIHIRKTCPWTTLARLYKYQIIRLHGVLREIVSD